VERVERVQSDPLAIRFARLSSKVRFVRTLHKVGGAKCTVISPIFRFLGIKRGLDRNVSRQLEGHSCMNCTATKDFR
jgi:hypothetical protein